MTSLGFSVILNPLKNENFFLKGYEITIYCHSDECQNPSLLLCGCYSIFDITRKHWACPNEQTSEQAHLLFQDVFWHTPE